MSLLIYYSARQKYMEAKLESIYYSLKGYWKGEATIGKLAMVAKVSEKVALAWLKEQPIWQIYLPALPRISRPKFDISVPNKVY